mmetsp:Transcript_12426/g.50836  ORF Transcript_12426/g.50836 Transcript_12426/m.50836 type:complete len:175 (-) Transcript_12426:1339-1863(-)
MKLLTTVSVFFVILGAIAAVRMESSSSRPVAEPEIDPPIPTSPPPPQSALKKLTIDIGGGNFYVDHDGWGAGISDPYAVVTAFTTDGRRVTRSTRVASEQQFPRWEQRLPFGSGDWRSFRIKVYDSDSFGNDDLMLETPIVNIQNWLNHPIPLTDIQRPWQTGYVFLDELHLWN